MREVLDRLTAALSGRYRIERELGAGGMATVYLAEDLRHGRRVAIKVLRPELAAVIGAERFVREIRTVAALQHPHILGLIDSGEAEGTAYYVMPFVEGESLRDRLAREKQLPVADAIRIATEVAAALDYAHRHGVIHRDIKPENILLHDGQALVADFGIALAASHAGGARMTETGMSLGTPQYMSPEQAMGERELTPRSDVYALGAVTYEMLAGEPPFTGHTAQAIVARVLTETPRPLTAQRHTVPPHVEAAVLTALEKLPADRFASAGELAAALADGRTHHTSSRAKRGIGSLMIRSLVAAALGLALLAAGFALAGRRAEPPPTRRAVLVIEGLLDRRDIDLAVSADGRVIAVNGGRGVPGLVLRAVGDLEAHLVPGTEGATRPFLSADGSRVGFHRAGSLVVQRTDGSVVAAVGNAAGEGATFVDDRRVVTAEGGELLLIDLASRTRERLLAAPAGVAFQQPFALPGGRRVVFTAVTGGLGDALALAVDLRSRRVDTLVRDALTAQYAGGWLFYARPNGELDAVRFDPDAAAPSGDAVPVGDRAMVSRTAVAAFRVAPGTLVYGPRQRGRLVMLEPGGRRSELIGALGTYHNPRLSPDGGRIVIDQDLGGLGGRDVWVLDRATGTLARISSVGDGHDAVWTPDGRRVTYLSFARPEGPVFTVPADGGPGREVMRTAFTINPGVWLPDGRRYLAGIISPGRASDILVLHRDGSPPDTIAASAYDEHSPALSADGRFLAYTSNATGRRQVYVRALDGSGQLLVSEASGEEPAWSRRGNELYYVEHGASRTRLLAARIEPADGPRVVSRRVVLEEFRYEPVGNHTNWDLTADGEIVFVEPETDGQLVMVSDWRPR